MDKKVQVQGREMTLRANALLPRKYRHMFERDMIADMRKLIDDYQKKNEVNYDVLEDLTWLMFREAGEDVGSSPEEWLQTIDDVFEVYMLLPDVCALWIKNQKTTAAPKKK